MDVVGDETGRLSRRDVGGLCPHGGRLDAIAEPVGNVAPVPVLSPPSCSLLSCNFSSAASGDPNVGDTFARLWNFGDGTTSTATAPSRTFLAARIYTVMLTVTDGWGKSASTSLPVTIAGG